MEFTVVELGKKRGRKLGTKIEKMVKVSEFIPVYREMVEEGRNSEEIGVALGLKPATVLAKRAEYNKKSREAGHPLDLPLPVGESGKKGPKLIDWSKWTLKVNESVNS